VVNDKVVATLYKIRAHNDSLIVICFRFRKVKPLQLTWISAAVIYCLKADWMRS